MKQNKRKHMILIVILLSMAFVSTLYVRDRDYVQKNKRIAIIYPKHSQSLIQEIQEGIQDCAYDHQVKLDVWYKDELSKMNSMILLHRNIRIRPWAYCLYIQKSI